MLDAMMDLGRRQVTMCETVDVLAKEAPDIYSKINTLAFLFFLSPFFYHHGTASSRPRRRSPAAAAAVKYALNTPPERFLLRVT